MGIYVYNTKNVGAMNGAPWCGADVGLDRSQEKLQNAYF